MQLYEKKVCLKCSLGDIEFSFDTALSLMLENVKTNVVYYASDEYLNYTITLLNKFIELVKNENNTIIIDYKLDNQENEQVKDIYSSIVSGLNNRLDYIINNVIE